MKVLLHGRDDLKPLMERRGVEYSEITGAVREIIDTVRVRGDSALLEYTERFDKVRQEGVRLTKDVIDRAYRRVDREVILALKHAHNNISAIHRMQYRTIDMEWTYDIERGVSVGERTTPIGSVGCYVPGGRAAYPSTVLMTVTPAKIAGVKRIAVASPPPVSDVVLAACRIAGADEVYSMGGAQAIAALAYGTKAVKPVNKIVGPGNKYVTAAKMLVFGTVDVDMPAGPSELLVVADNTANPSYIAADLLAQAEHDPDAQSILASDSPAIIAKVGAELDKTVPNVKRRLGAITAVKTKSLSESIRFANEYAPEHLEVQTKNAERDAEKIVNAGAIFVGPYSCVAAGDYATGGNHVLPTGGTARFSSQLSVRDFLKTGSVQKLTKDGLKKLSKTITTLAEGEGLEEHGKSVKKRLD